MKKNHNAYIRRSFDAEEDYDWQVTDKLHPLLSKMVIPFTLEGKRAQQDKLEKFLLRSCCSILLRNLLLL